ncbi:MAG: FRG domain-containing protein [Terrimonas sp.]|nr:FRG domain-containing protein [Terrimonas sp.]OJY93176.1 MAG: hypothetical protein BGP13_16175 [Sphingobacteriales bacterium 40-81]
MNAKSHWAKFLNEVDEALKDLDVRANEECFYRGHGFSHYKLLPGLFRGLPDKRLNRKQKESIQMTEYNLFYEFRARAKEANGQNISDWDILFYMQHHLCRTRLLDWSESLGVAVFFALLDKNKPSFSPVVYMLNPYAMNEFNEDARDLYSPEFLDDEDDNSYSDIINMEYPEFGWNKPLGIYPIRQVSRLIAQGGYFTIHGNDMRPIESILPEKKNIWRKIPLPIEALAEAERFLGQAGINEFTMFPDLDGLSKYLNRKYFL